MASSPGVACLQLVWHVLSGGGGGKGGINKGG